ncbi:MAG: methylmalonyl Co-A mutase-associated GTPase MeaB [Acidimicrobiia bacterium]
MTATAAASAAALVARLADGDRAALARLLTLAEAGGADTQSVLTALHPQVPSATVVGITGAPGAGKSTLTNRLIAAFRARGARVGVLAVDPSSPFSGGAILGDRVRMQDHEPDPDVYVRSMATRGQLGGLAGATPRFVRVLDAAGFDPVLVETVGVGQSEVAVAAAADTTVVVVTPGWGDSVQASKAGLLEVGDVFVVNKADRAATAATVRDLEAMLATAGPRGWSPPVLTTVATDGTGVAEVAACIEAHRVHLVASDALEERRERRVRDELRGLVLEALAQQADEVCTGSAFDSVVARVAAGSVDLYTASSDLLASER